MTKSNTKKTTVKKAGAKASTKPSKLNTTKIGSNRANTIVLNATKPASNKNKSARNTIMRNKPKTSSTATNSTSIFDRKKNKSVGQFRVIRNKTAQGHIGYLVRRKKIDKEVFFDFVGITHEPKTNKVKNIKLAINPNPLDKEKAYVRNKVDSANKSEVRKQKEGWKLCKKDKKTIKAIVNNKK